MSTEHLPGIDMSALLPRGGPESLGSARPLSTKYSSPEMSVQSGWPVAPDPISGELYESIIISKLVGVVPATSAGGATEGSRWQAERLHRRGRARSAATGSGGLTKHPAPAGQKRRHGTIHLHE